MEIESEELLGLLQGHWQLANDQQHFEIEGTGVTLHTKANTVKTSFELVRNLQLKNWQIKAKAPLAWLRTFIVEINEESFVLYDFEPTVAMAMGGRSRLLNPSRVFRYHRVAERVNKQPAGLSA